MGCDNGCDMNGRGNGRHMSECDKQISRIVRGRYFGRSLNPCTEGSPGSWDSCVPRFVQFDIDGTGAGWTFDGTSPATREATAAIVTFANGTKDPIALLDVMIDYAQGNPGGAGQGDVANALVLDQLLGPESGSQVYGTFAGKGSSIEDAGGAVAGVLGSLGRGIRLGALTPERAASFGASVNYGSILSKFKLPVIVGQQEFSFRVRAANDVAVSIATTFVSGQILAVKMSSKAVSAYLEKYGDYGLAA